MAISLQSKYPGVAKHKTASLVPKQRTSEQPRGNGWDNRIKVSAREGERGEGVLIDFLFEILLLLPVCACVSVCVYLCVRVCVCVCVCACV